MDEELIALVREASRRIRPLPTGSRTRGAFARRPAAVLFDVYGTLLQRLERTFVESEASVTRLIRRHRLRLQPRELHEALSEAIARKHAQMRKRGKSYPEVRIEHIWQRLFPNIPHSDLRQAVVEYELAMHPCWPMPGGRRLIDALVRDGFTMGIVSNAQFYTPLQFAALLGGRPEELGFAPDLCVYSWVHGDAKPSQDIFHRAASVLRGLGIGREEVLMVGNDPLNDIASSARAGFMTALVAADRRSAPAGTRREGPVPDVVVGRLADLPFLLKKAPPTRRGS